MNQANETLMYIGPFDDSREHCECPVCHGSKAVARDWEANEGGAINSYSNLYCAECGHFEGDTGEGGEYDHLFNNHEEAFYEQESYQEVIEDMIECEVASLDWLTITDFQRFARGIRTAA
jgi:hypothetical protein